MSNKLPHLADAVAYVQKQIGTSTPTVGLILGSGLGALADKLKNPRIVDYADIPGFPKSTVSGHQGRLVFGYWHDIYIVCMQGRAHLYEGYTSSEVVLPIRTLIKLGVQNILITNAAGGIHPDFDVGTLMLISDHINYTGLNPLVGPNDPNVGPRFPDLSDAYSQNLREIAYEVAKEGQVKLHEGVYLGLLGPSYETPAEIRMFAKMGADAVGMSTVLEVIAGVHAGAQIMGLSCITNRAAGLSAAPLRHEEVEEAARDAHSRLVLIIEGMVRKLGAGDQK